LTLGRFVAAAAGSATASKPTDATVKPIATYEQNRLVIFKARIPFPAPDPTSPGGDRSEDDEVR